ncbi:MAG TPA: hypothetical protein VFJ58_23550 [Armatimonadota bacterium]|nr:hypothetical protein [Armatimonadota bacterium]
MAEQKQSDAEGDPARGGAGCAIALGGIVAIMILVVGVLLAWPYLTGKSRRAHGPVVTHSMTPLLPPPEHSDLGPN